MFVTIYSIGSSPKSSIKPNKHFLTEEHPQSACKNPDGIRTGEKSHPNAGQVISATSLFASVFAPRSE